MGGGRRTPWVWLVALGGLAFATACASADEPLPGESDSRPASRSSRDSSEMDRSKVSEDGSDEQSHPGAIPDEYVSDHGRPYLTPGALEEPPVYQPPLPEDPGVVVLRRLNRLEYNNTVRDLLGTALTPADGFPDDTDSDFDTSAQALTISPIHARQYLAATEVLLDDLYTSPERLATVVDCDPVAEGRVCAEGIVARFAFRAWRRPVSDSQLKPLFSLFDVAESQEEDLATGVRLALQAALLSPHFMFHVELDEDPNSSEPHALSEYELANRLSYFLWSSMPDAELFADAESGELSTDAGLESAVERMLADSKAEALVDSFAKHWLLLDAMEKHIVDPGAFPAFDDELKLAMIHETRLFFADFLQKDRPIPELLTTRLAFVDARLAAHYGLDYSGANFSRVNTSDSVRIGLLTQGTILTATSGSAQTAPVKRGRWVLKNLLCSAPPPPPPDIPALEEEDDGSPKTLRERLEAHRSDPSCAGCHQLLDPIGFGLENFDAVGQYRTEYEGQPIDASSAFVDGRSFETPEEMARLLSEDPALKKCVTQQLLSFALGRDFGKGRDDDRLWIGATSQAAGEGAGLASTIRAVVMSDPFRLRRGQEESP